ncbi:hypothetical protein [Pseudomonas kuykendallii]|uniref:NifB/NifX family molybdenum-iron cluster-binding protein n=1 Tax=Pseudomonas kuykendallii TaxID=1007099 RepID=UPI0028D6A90A|nr:hypothetical protein [Pseudomonas kuykendallii]
MRLIGVSSQDGRTVTGHAGRCRRFFLFGDRGGPMMGTLELTAGQVLHRGPPGADHPLGRIKVLVTAGMRPGLQASLASCGIDVFITDEQSPELAVRRFLEGAPSLPCLDGRR